MRRIVCLLALLASSALAQSIVCGEWGEPRKDFVEFSNPVIGLSKVGLYFPESQIDPDWYIVEGHLAPAMGFSSYFVHDPKLKQFVYVDGIEGGIHDPTPAIEWRENGDTHTEMFGRIPLDTLFQLVATLAPTCTLTPKAAQ